ncbi:MAG: helix-turn-helix transcriptional regulator [Candidatus Hodarchaeales archaeon]|jgi:DNA-binding PadR family transcriptional regulator
MTGMKKTSERIENINNAQRTKSNSKRLMPLNNSSKEKRKGKKGPKELGWLQLSILIMLWDKEMYGLEIKEHLAIKGYPVSTGQLYPGLLRLEEFEALSSREEERVGANRKFYKTTDIGKQYVLEYTEKLSLLFLDLFTEKLAFVANDIQYLVEFRPGTIVADLSWLHIEGIVTTLAELVSPTGRWFIPSPDKKATKIIKQRVEHYGLHDTATIVELSNDMISLPDQSVDIALALFTLHEDETDWIVKEMARILKPRGKGVIVDMIPPKEENVFLDLLIAFLPRHSEFGLNVAKLKQLLDNNKLSIHQEKEEKGLIYLVVERE